jgi:hypothetical protein
MVEQKPSKLPTLADFRHIVSKTSHLSAVSFQSLIFRAQNISGAPIARIEAFGGDAKQGSTRSARAG